MAFPEIRSQPSPGPAAATAREERPRPDVAPEAAVRCERPILLVTEIFPPAVGGSAVLYANVYSRLGSPGIHVLTDPAISPGPAGPRGVFHVHHARLATPHWGLANPGGLRHHWRAATGIRQLSRELDGATIHCGRALPEGVAAWIARLRGGVPYVCWAHGEDLSTANTSRELTFVMARVYAAAAGVLANSHNTADTLVRLGVDREKIQVAHPGVDPERFHPQVDGSAIRRRHVRDGELMLLTVGRLQRRKGQDLVIRAMAQLSRIDLRFVIVGGGEEEGHLRALAVELGVADRVDFAGKVPDDELPAYYAASDVFLMPNRQDGADFEGFGIVFLEAQATGRPVIAGRTGGAPEAVSEGETALLVGGDDPAELARTIERLAASPDERARLGRAGRDRVARGFSWTHTTRSVAELQRRVEVRS